MTKKRTVKKTAKKAVKKTIKKTAQKKTVEKPKKKAVKKQIVKAQGGNGIARELLLERKYTDEEIIKRIQNKLPDRDDIQCKVYISVQRSELNSGAREGLKKNEKLERIVQVNGKKIPYSQAPKKSNITNKKKREMKMLKKHTNIEPVTRKRKVLKSV